MTIVLKEMAIKNLQELADYEYQRRLWLSSGPPEVSSFDEACAGLYEDSCLTDVLDQGREVVFTEEIDDLLRELDRLLKKIDDSQSVEGILADSQMEQVRKLAAEILRRIDEAT